MAADRPYRVETWSAKSKHSRNGRNFKEGDITHYVVTNYSEEAKAINFTEVEETAAVILPINPRTNVDDQRKIAEAINDYMNKIQEAKERAINAAQLGFLK